MNKLQSDAGIAEFVCRYHVERAIQMIYSRAVFVIRWEALESLLYLIVIISQCKCARDYSIIHEHVVVYAVAESIRCASFWKKKV